MPNLRYAAIATLTAVSLTACGGSIVVQVTVDDEVVDDLEVQFIPFDRDSLFAAIAADAPTPEPQMPADLAMVADSVQGLQAVWRETEQAWNNIRDTLRNVSDRLESLDRRSAEYRRLFDTFDEIEGRERTLNRRRQAAFDNFDALQQSTQARLDSMRIVVEAWEDVAFADYVDIESGLLDALGAEIAADTTDSEGVARGSAGGGPWWVHARVNVTEGELYWNVMVDGASADTVRLDRNSAELRRVY